MKLKGDPLSGEEKEKGQTLTICVWVEEGKREGEGAKFFCPETV